MDLGYTPEPMESPATEGKPKQPETRYPSLDLQDGSVDALKGDSGHKCAVGDEYYADGVRLRVKSAKDDEYGKSLSFDVLSVDEFEPADAEEADNEEQAGGGGEAATGKSPKALRYS